MVVHTCNPALGKLRHEDQCELEVSRVSIREFKTSQCYISKRQKQRKRTRFQETSLLENKHIKENKSQSRLQGILI